MTASGVTVATTVVVTILCETFSFLIQSLRRRCNFATQLPCHKLRSLLTMLNLLTLIICHVDKFIKGLNAVDQQTSACLYQCRYECKYMLANCLSTSTVALAKGDFCCMLTFRWSGLCACLCKPKLKNELLGRRQQSNKFILFMFLLVLYHIYVERKCFKIDFCLMGF